MGGPPQDLKPGRRRSPFASFVCTPKLPKSDTVAQVLGKQCFVYGTSVGANYRGSVARRSKAEFVSKIGDCLKEVEETEYWLELLVDSGCVPGTKMASLLDETRQLNASHHHR